MILDSTKHNLGLEWIIAEMKGPMPIRTSGTTSQHNILLTGVYHNNITVDLIISPTSKNLNTHIEVPYIML